MGRKGKTLASNVSVVHVPHSKEKTTVRTNEMLLGAEPGRFWAAPKSCLGIALLWKPKRPAESRPMTKGGSLFECGGHGPVNKSIEDLHRINSKGGE
jgi:hypothetical protein